MFEIVGPVGNRIQIPETVEHDAPSFQVGEREEVRDFYNEQGYVVIRDAIDPILCDELRAAFDGSVKKYPGFLYRQETANPEKNVFDSHGFVMNPLLNLQDLPSSVFTPLKRLSLRCFTQDPVRSIVRILLDEDGTLVQSMYFEGNPETWAHQDTYYLDSEQLGAMVSGWFALEDIKPGAGRFYVLRGSHKINVKKNGGEFNSAFKHSRYKDLIKKIISDNALELRAPCLRKGDVLFWNSKTIHGSLKTVQPEYSRSSLTAQYIPASHKLLQFQSRIKALKLKEYNGISVHCPKDLDRPINRLILGIETRFPKTFHMSKKMAILVVTQCV
ncbi:MAG: phytanoyl-CoA dioxygenase family protein [Gammaproteobacteria bacterium]